MSMERAKTKNSDMATVKELIRKENRGQILTMFDSLLKRRCRLEGQDAKDFFTKNGMTYNESRSVILTNLELSVKAGLQSAEGRALVDDVAAFYSIPPDSVNVAVANAIYDYLIGDQYNLAVALGSIYNHNKKDMEIAIGRAWSQHMVDQDHEKAARLARKALESGIIVNSEHFFEGPASLAFKRALAFDISAARGIKTDLKMDNELTAKAAKDFLIERLTSDHFYRSYLLHFYPNGSPVWRICTEFKVDKHSAGREAFIFNVGHLNFRKARMTANLMGLSREEQKLFAIEACDRLTLGAVGPEELQTISKISARFELDRIHDGVRTMQ